MNMETGTLFLTYHGGTEKILQHCWEYDSRS